MLSRYCFVPSRQLGLTMPYIAWPSSGYRLGILLVILSNRCLSVACFQLSKSQFLPKFVLLSTSTAGNRNRNALSKPGGVEDKNSRKKSPFEMSKNPSYSSIASVASSASSSSPNLRKTTVDNRWDSFDYNLHWYPVAWACDILENRPTKITLFDVEYVVAKDSNNRWTALEDRCPHKSAALSEGRMTSSGFIQCTYHGWSFNGTTGNCVQIPQAAGATDFPSRTCAKSIPIKVHQEMVRFYCTCLEAIL